ncbi:hypothetical protein ASG78_04350 [Nostocoides sp. Soil756]|nr:hypothetical protein ASG78_04350 [Tetrasphaera sp. Soil756]
MAVVVIHHRRFPAVLETLHDIVAAQVPTSRLVVVDNSENEETATALEASAEGWHVVTVSNKGYGAAANTGVQHVADSDLVLVLTHEVRIDAASVAALIRTIAEDPSVAAAGPGLVVTDRNAVWSRGGALSRHLLLPRQIRSEQVGLPRVNDVDWLDGACVAYRTSDLLVAPFREDFFLYFEETELHTRLRRAGRRVVTVGDATAYQSSAGMPAYLGCRNYIVFLAAHGSRPALLVGPWIFLVRAMVASLAARRWGEILAAPRGLVAGYRSLRTRTAARPTAMSDTRGPRP